MAIQVHEKKLQRQLIGVEKWRTSESYGAPKNGCGTWWWETGMGKTYAACIIINKLLIRNSSSTIVVIVPGSELEKQWKNEVKNFVDIKYQENIKIFTIDKIVDNHYKILCTFLILDEIHEYLTEQRIKVIDGTYIDATYKLGLTATWLDRENRQKKIEKFLPVIDRINEVEAEKEGWISKSIEYNVGVELTKTELEEYQKHSKVINSHLNKFGKDPFTTASKVLTGHGNVKGYSIACSIASANGWYQGMDLSIYTNQQIFEIWSPKKIVGYAAQLMEAVRERKNILYNAQEKLKYAKDIVLKFDTLKTICFSQSTFFADRLSYLINEQNKKDKGVEKNICVSYHSNIETQIYYDEKLKKERKKGKTILKREAIDAIKTGKVRIISTASSLDRGFDVPDIRLGITTSGTQNPTQYTQRGGRVKRVEDYEKDIIVLIINLYVKNTKDEDWLRKRQSKTKNVIYWCDSVHDINYNPQPQETFNLNEF